MNKLILGMCAATALCTAGAEGTADETWSASRTVAESETVEVANLTVAGDGIAVTNAGAVNGTKLVLREGSYVQKSGTSKYAVSTVVGNGYDTAAARELTVESGAFSVPKRVIVGLGSSEKSVPRFVVSGGEVSIGSEDMAISDPRYLGLAISRRFSDNDPMGTMLDQWADTPVESIWTTGDFLMTGGEVSAANVSFGSSGECGKDFNNWGRFTLAGGVFTLGNRGFLLNSGWNKESGRYEVVLSGGTLAAYGNFTNTLATRLSNRDGGVTLRADAGKSMTFAAPLYGEGGFTKTGAGTVRLVSPSDYLGETRVAEGRLEVLGEGIPVFARWAADDCATNATAAVAAWSASSGAPLWTYSRGRIVNSALDTRSDTAPTYRSGVFNGHGAVYFNGEQNGLGLAAGDYGSQTPAGGQSAFSVAVVLQVTSDECANFNQAVNWPYGAGIVGQSDPGAGVVGDWGLVMRKDGCIGAGYTCQQGNAPANQTVWSQQSIADGTPHVVVFTWQKGGVSTLNVDGAKHELAFPEGATPANLRTMYGFIGYLATATDHRFKGCIGEIAMIRSALSVAEQDALGSALAAKYGATWAAKTAVAQTSAASAETAEAEPLPAATAVWSAEDAGEGAVSAWTSRTGSWIFKASADLPKDSTPPNISSVKGHKTVSFDGVSNSLFLTGNAPTPAGKATNLVLAAVVKFNGRGTGVSTQGWQDWTPFVGMGFVNSGEYHCWGLAFSSVGRLAAGTRDGWGVSLTVRSAARGLDDGELHTVVWSVSMGEDAAPQVLLVDGERTEGDAATAPVKALTNSRILLGATEYNNIFRYLAMDLAELRFYKDVAFSAAQMTALAEELRAAYGTPFVGNRADLGRGETCFADLVLGEKGVVAGIGGTDLVLHPGQSLTGAGTVEGTLVVKSGASFALDEAGNYPKIRHIRFEDGAILKLVSSGDVSSVKPLFVPGVVEFPSGTVYMDASACKSHVRPADVLTWGGDAIDRGVSFEATGKQQKNFAAKLKAKRLSARFSTGFVLSIR